MRRRADAAALALLCALSPCCSHPVARAFTVGTHHVRLVPPAEWEVLEHDREHVFRRGEMAIDLVDLGPAGAAGMVRDLHDARAVWMKGRRLDAFARVRALRGPPLVFATSDERAEVWREWYDATYDPGRADSAAIGLAFDELGDRVRRLRPVPRASLVEYVLESFPQAERNQIEQQSQRPVNGRQWTEVHTWNRISHLGRSRIAFVDDGGHVLALAIDRGPIEITGPVFESLLGSIEVKPDSSRTP